MICIPMKIIPLQIAILIPNYGHTHEFQYIMIYYKLYKFDIHDYKYNH
jgi:hypothetical protein